MSIGADELREALAWAETAVAADRALEYSKAVLLYRQAALLLDSIGSSDPQAVTLAAEYEARARALVSVRGAVSGTLCCRLGAVAAGKPPLEATASAGSHRHRCKPRSACREQLTSRLTPRPATSFNESRRTRGGEPRPRGPRRSAPAGA